MDGHISQKNSKPCPLKKLKKWEIEARIPEACSEALLNAYEETICNEHEMWVQDLLHTVPIWSRTRKLNCLARKRGKQRKHYYDIEIPNRLISLWGTRDVHKNTVKSEHTFQGYQYVSNILAICSIFRFNFDQWSPATLDQITLESKEIYSDLKQRHIISKKNFRISKLNNSYKLGDTTFQVKLYKVAEGIIFSLKERESEFNLARALLWFFRNYQFGLLQCGSRCVAFGYAVDLDMPYFMYDCQSSGSPLFKKNNSGSYVLRTNYLQILLYCLTVTLGSLDNDKFVVYLVDAQLKEMKVSSSQKGAKNKTAKSNSNSNKSMKKSVKKEHRLRYGRDRS